MSWYLLWVSCQCFLSPFCHGYSLECHWSVLTFVHFSPLCHGYSLGVSWQLSFCLHYVMGTHWGCLVNDLFVSFMSWVLIRSALTILSICLHFIMGTLSPLCHRVLIVSVFRIVYVSPLCHRYSLGYLDNCLFVYMVSRVLIGSIFSIVFYLHDIRVTYWKCRKLSNFNEYPQHNMYKSVP